MTKIALILSLSLMLMTACAQQKPEQNITTPEGSGVSSPAAAEDGTTPAATPEVYGPVTAISSGSLGTPLSEITPNPTSPATEPPPGSQPTITRQDNGKTINMKVGDSFLLQLGEEYNWDISVSDPSVLNRVRNIAVIRGAQGVYQAFKPGTVTLNANGDPLCRQANPPCGMPSMLIEITIVVK